VRTTRLRPPPSVELETQVEPQMTDGVATSEMHKVFAIECVDEDKKATEKFKGIWQNSLREYARVKCEIVGLIAKGDYFRREGVNITGA